MATKGITVFTQNGEDFTINDPNVANEFSTGTAYAIGDHVTYQGNLYVFTAAHSAGAWNAAHVTQVTIGEELNENEAAITDLKSELGAIKSFDRGNLFKRATVTEGQYIKDNGETGNSSTLFFTDYIFVESGHKYVWSTSPLSSPGGFYDLNKNWKKVISVENYGANYSSYTPSEAGYVRINANVSYLRSLIVCLAGEEQYGAFTSVGDDQVIQNKNRLIEIIEPYNLYNKIAPVTENSILLDSGEIREASGYFITDYIEIPSGGEYTVSFTLSSQGCTYDKDKNYIRGISSQSTSSNPKTFTLFEDEKYVRLNIDSDMRDTFVFVRGKRCIANKNGQKLIAGMFMNENLYSQEGVEVGKLLLDNGTIIESANYAITGYIELPGTGTYTVPYTFSSPGCVYNANKEIIGVAYSHSTDSEAYTFEISNENARYIRLNIFASSIGTFQFCKGYELTNVPKGAKMIDGLKVRAEDVIGGGAFSRWANKNIVCFGDSRTWYDGEKYTSSTKPEWAGKTCKGYQQTIAEYTNAILINQGVSGDTSKQICDRIREYDFSQASAVLLEGGVNDFVKSSQVEIGEIQPIGSTFNVDTVYGAWQSAVEYILRNYPQVKIFMDIPAIAWLSGEVFPYNIAKIKGEIAELYNIPCYDLYKNGGISECNRDYYYVDNVASTGWYLHFNDYGNALIGAILAGFINTQ